MDIFSLNNQTYSNGKLINNIDSVLWVEKYSDAGEFTITGSPTKQLMDDLAIGTLISHTDTLSVMMVENHSIDETKDGEPKLEITGRTIDAISMENRVIANNLLPSSVLQKYDDQGFLGNYTTSYYDNRPSSWGQIEELITLFLITPNSTTKPDSFGYPNFAVRSIPSYRANDPVIYKYPLTAKKLETVYSNVTSLLNATKSGLKIVRPNKTQTTLDFVIHQGIDLSSTIQFNWESGDLENLRYLWTNKGLKNSIYVTSDSFGIRVLPSFIVPPVPNSSGWDLRFTSVDVGDVSQYYADPNALTSTERTNLEGMYRTAGLKELGNYKSGLFMDATVSKTAKYIYGKDYNIGDIVYVIGNYGAEAKMRVTEYAMTSDSTGESGIPTLSPM